MKTEAEVKNDFTQLCVIQGMMLGEMKPKEFEDAIFADFKTRIKFEAEVRTLPDLDENDMPVKGTGNRTDIFFYVHHDDVMKFAVPRFQLGARWWEDVIHYNKGNKHLYTAGFRNSHPATW